MAKIKNMGTSTMKFKEGIIVDGTAGTDIHSLVITGSTHISSDIYATQFTGSLLRLDQNGTGLIMTNIGAFDNSSGNFRIFSNNDLILSTNGDSGTAVTIDATSKNATFQGDIILTDEKTIGTSGDSNFVRFSENSTTYSGTDLSIGSNQSAHVLLDMNADGATVGGFTVRTGGTTIDASDEVFKFGGDGKIAASKGTVAIEAIETSTYKTLQGSSATTAVLEDTTFTGLGTNSFTFSCWFYQNDTNSNPVSSNTKVRFLQSSTERHVLNLGVSDVTIQYENTAGTFDIANFDTNLTSGNWYHVVAHFDVGNLTTGAPRLWINGQEIAAANYTAIGGTTPDIDRVTIYLDDGPAMQDAVFWNKLLSDSEISELWNNGYYMNPSLHSATDSIASYFLLGQEDDLSSFNNGDTLSGIITLTDTAGSGNAFTLTLESEFSILSRTVQEISSPGFEVDSFSIGINRSFTPMSANDTGKKGEIAWDENYIYVCVATDTWKRAALTSW